MKMSCYKTKILPHLLLGSTLMSEHLIFCCTLTSTDDHYNYCISTHLLYCITFTSRMVTAASLVSLSFHTRTQVLPEQSCFAQMTCPATLTAKIVFTATARLQSLPLCPSTVTTTVVQLPCLPTPPRMITTTTASHTSLLMATVSTQLHHFYTKNGHRYIFDFSFLLRMIISTVEVVRHLHGWHLHASPAFLHLCGWTSLLLMVSCTQ